MPITHAFVNPNPDEPGPPQVRPSHWNADHVGAVEDTFPIADPTDVVIDDTTYDNLWTNVGKIRTVVFPTATVESATALDGDDFPREARINPSDGYYYGDGTVNPLSGGAAWWIQSKDVNGNFAQVIEGGKGGTQRIIAGHLDANAGYGTSFEGGAAFRIGVETAPGQPTPFTLSFGTGAPVIGGNVGDICFRTDPGGANQTIYRCTVAGTAGNATWVGIL